MTNDQILLFSLFGLIFAMLLWGRWRYDLIAFSGLLIALVLGLVPTEQAFSGFGHPATIIVALVLVVSRGLVNSGAIALLMQRLAGAGTPVGRHITQMAIVGAALSGFMNNVAALALLMPIDIQVAAKAGRLARRSLMPLSFATILGGMVTLIGTPPNIIIASFREKAIGEPFAMFDFAPVGITVTVIGILYVATIGWRLIPGVKGENSKAKAAIIDDYAVELVVGEKSKLAGGTISAISDQLKAAGLRIIGLTRNGRPVEGKLQQMELRVGDILITVGDLTDIDEFRGKLDLKLFGEEGKGREAVKDLSIMEVVVPKDARIEGRSAISLRLRSRKRVTLVGISRQGRLMKKRVRHEPIRAGDILLLLGTHNRLEEVSDWLGTLPLAERGLQVTQHSKAWLAVGIFAAAIAVSSFGLLYLATALAIVVALYAFLDIVPLRSLYDHIEWPVIVLLGSMIPLGVALENSGGTDLLASLLVSATEGYAPWVALAVLMTVIMTMSDVLNNTATAVVGGPIAISVAERLGVNPDPFLMAVAIAASCAFLTPIGHKNNTLIMGPGGYSFGDYWRMGLPLEILVIAVSVPMILVVFPL